MSISQKYPEAWDFYNDRPGKENPMSNKDMTSLRSSQGNLPSERPQRAEYQAEWTFAEALSEYADSLESERDRLRERVAELEKMLDKCRQEFCWHGNTGKMLTVQKYGELVDEIDAILAKQ